MEYALVESKIRALCLSSEASSGLPPLVGNSEFYYSLSGLDSEEKKKIQTERLKHVLNQLQKERDDTTFSRNCLFCCKHFTGNRSVLLDHLLEQHNFSVGKPDNIVFINELLDHLEQLLKEFKCFFCEKIFKDWDTLKEHMRKKQHKRIDPNNKSYDRFYLINYLELGKTWIDIQEEDDGPQDGDEKELMDWQEEDSVFVCLFCVHKTTDFEQILLHMKESHGFDLQNLKLSYKLDFYKRIKLINYIRKKVYEKVCIYCSKEFNFHEQLSQHLVESGHSAILPDPDLWDQPQYFFSTFENDSLLCALDSDDSDPEDM